MRVLRVRQGEEITLLDGAGQVTLCRVLEASKRLRLEIISQEFVKPIPYSVTLVQALPKGKIFETILQKASELGAKEIVPLLSERVIARFEDEDIAEKLVRWKQVTTEAIKQCGTPWLPVIKPPISLSDYLRQQNRFDLSLVGSLHPGAQHPGVFFAEYKQQHGKKPDSVSLWVGPEGDFTPGEINQIVSAGAKPVTLGRFVLRSETAAVYCLSVCNYELEASESRSG